MILDQYGLGGKWASNRAIWIGASDLYPQKTSEDTVYEKALEAGRKAVQEDGAEVLIAGCTLIGSVVTHRVKDPMKEFGAPFIDGMVPGFKMAEMMADMCSCTGMPPVSRAGFFQHPPQNFYETLRRHLGKPV